MQTKTKRTSSTLLSAAILLAATGAGFGATNVLEFVGESRVYIEESTVFQQNFEAMTLEFWFKLNDVVDDWAVMIHRHDAGGDNVGGSFWWAGFATDGILNVTFNARNSHWEDGKTAVQPATGVWHHVAGVWDGDQGHVYLNGALIHSYATVPMTGNGEGGMAFGGTVGGALDYRAFEGQLSEVRLWDHARSEETIDFLRHYRLTTHESGLIGYWPLDEGGGTVVFDGSATGSDGDIVGAVWTTTETLDLDPDLGFTLMAPFSLANLVTGGTQFTGDNEVALVGLQPPAAATHFQFTEDPDVEALTGSWIPTNTLPATTTFALPAEDGPVALYAWFTNTTESAQDPPWRAASSIIYTTAEPTAQVEATLLRAAGRAIFPSDIDALSTGGSYAGEPLAIHAMKVLVQTGPGADATPGAPEATLYAPGEYTLALQVVNEAGNTALSDVCVATVIAVANVSAEGGDWVFTQRFDGIPYRIHVFTNTTEVGMLTVTGLGEIDYLVVAGGGGGGFRTAGGGGAGGVILRRYEPIAGGDYPVVVGDGGARRTTGGRGFDGEYSSFYGSVALGGGGGGARGQAPNYFGRDGGSGGGRGQQGVTIAPQAGAGLQPVQAGKSRGYGHDGFHTGDSIGSGGGGAGAPGGETHAGRSGGIGIEVSHLFTDQIGQDGWVGGGGAGNGSNNGTTTPGSLGGGGRSVAARPGEDAMPATGGGGAGGSDNTGDGSNQGGGAGGSGIVVIRYEYYPGTLIRVR